MIVILFPPSFCFWEGLSRRSPVQPILSHLEDQWQRRQPDTYVRNPRIRGQMLERTAMGFAPQSDTSTPKPLNLDSVDW